MDVWSIDMRAPGWSHCAWETQPETFNRCQFSLLVAHLECILGLWSQCYWELWGGTFTGETIKSLPEVATFWRWTLFKGPQILFSRKINIVPKNVVQGKNTLWSKFSPDLDGVHFMTRMNRKLANSSPPDLLGAGTIDFVWSLDNGCWADDDIRRGVVFAVFFSKNTFFDTGIYPQVIV